MRIRGRHRMRGMGEAMGPRLPDEISIPVRTPLPVTPSATLPGQDFGFNAAQVSPENPLTIVANAGPAQTTVAYVPTTTPPDGPLPPGPGYQQIEDPGNPYPYVYIGPGSGASQAAPSCAEAYWSLYPDVATNDYFGRAGGEERAWMHYIQYGHNEGRTWPCGTQTGQVAAYTPAAAKTSQQLLTAQQLLALRSSSSGSNFGSSVSQFFSQYKWWIVGGVVGFVVVPPLLKRVGR